MGRPSVVGGLVGGLQKKQKRPGNWGFWRWCFVLFKIVCVFLVVLF